MRVCRRNISDLRYADDTILLAESNNDLKRHFWPVRCKLKDSIIGYGNLPSKTDGMYLLSLLRPFFPLVMGNVGVIPGAPAAISHHEDEGCNIGMVLLRFIQM